MQCPKCKCKCKFGFFETLFKRKKGSKNYFCVKCNAEVKFKTNYLKLFTLVVCTGAVSGIIGGLLNTSGGAIGGATAGVIAAVVAFKPFTKVELISNETSLSTV